MVILIVMSLAHQKPTNSLSQQIRIWWHANQLINSKHLQRFPEPSKWSLSLVHLATQSWGRLLIWQLYRWQSLTPFTRRVSHKHSLPKKLAVRRVLYPSMLTKSWVEGKSVEEKDAQPTKRTTALWGLSSKIDSRIWVNFTRNGLRLGSWHQEHHTQTCQWIWLQMSSEASYLGWGEKELDCCPVVQSPLFRSRFKVQGFVYSSHTQLYRI